MLDREQILNYVGQIERRGFVELCGLVDSDILDAIDQTIEGPLNTPTINGRYGYVKHRSSRFLAHTLSWGRNIIDIYTDETLIDLAERYVGDEVHLTNYRIYRTFPSPVRKMHWHVDNKVDVFDVASNQFITTMDPEDKGVILILYLSDVEDGGFQFVEGSHRWSYLHNRESWNDMELEFADHIVTFNDREKGTAIIYDTRGIHRAKPFTGGKIRTSLFGQYSSSRMPTGEPVILNARDLVGLSELQMRVLNFGHKPTTHHWPVGEPLNIVEDLEPLAGTISLRKPQ
jgi:hypothetical protein